MNTKAKPLELYLAQSSAHEEKRLVAEFHMHLAPSEQAGKVSQPESAPPFGTKGVQPLGSPGYIEHWKPVYLKAASKADLIVVFMGKHYLSETQFIAEREACAELAKDGKPVFVVVLNPCRWEHTPLGSLPSLMQGGKTLVEMDEPDRDRFFINLVQDIENGNLIRQHQPASANGFSHVSLNRLKLNNFKCFQSLDLDFSIKDSILGGSWTCIAGINGAGKSTILEAIALCLLDINVPSGTPVSSAISL